MEEAHQTKGQYCGWSGAKFAWIGQFWFLFQKALSSTMAKKKDFILISLWQEKYKYILKVWTIFKSHTNWQEISLSLVTKDV